MQRTIGGRPIKRRKGLGWHVMHYEVTINGRTYRIEPLTPGNSHSEWMVCEEIETSFGSLRWSWLTTQRTYGEAVKYLESHLHISPVSN